MGISERPWTQSGLSIHRVLVADCEGLGDRDRQGTADDIAHAVACVNAIHAAGITPEALAADPLCVKRLVDTSLRTVRVFAEDECDFADVAADTASSLRACGIEVPA